MRVFISYRRADSPFFAGRLRDRLALEYGEDNVFLDVDSTPLGADFRSVIRDTLNRVDLVIALIGPDWNTSRLAVRDDFVRMELDETLRQHTPLIPVLIGETPMPKARELPEQLASLVYLNALRVRPDPDFGRDSDRLINGIAETVGRETSLSLVTREASPVPDNRLPPAQLPQLVEPPFGGQPSGRRRPAAKSLVISAALAGLVSVAVGGYVLLRSTDANGTEYIKAIWAQAAVSDDGSGDVTEAIDWNFAGEMDKHGINRDIPNLPLNAPITVESPNAPDDVEISAQPNGMTRIRVGDPAIEVSGEHRYQIDFPLTGLVEGSQLDWEAIGTSWSVRIDTVEIHVVTPFELHEIQCFQGRSGSTERCDNVRQIEPGHVVATHNGLAPHEGLSIEARVGSRLEAAPALSEPPPAPT